MSGSRARAAVAGAGMMLAACTTGETMTHPTVVLETTLGDIRIELLPESAPLSAENFLAYVDSGFYDGLIFHRVIPGFMVQAGGHQPDMTEKPATRSPIINESDNGLANLRGTISMARLPDPHSARAQFFINLVDNAMLDHGGRGDWDPGSGDEGWGYAVFGRVIEGMDVVDAIAAQPTGTLEMYQDVPLEPILITSARRSGDVTVQGGGG